MQRTHKQILSNTRAKNIKFIDINKIGFIFS